MALSRSQLDSALTRWLEERIITLEQAERIRTLEAEVPATPAFSPVQVLTWLGGLLALVASVVFIAVDWNHMGAWQQAAWVAAGIAVVWVLAWALRRHGGEFPEQASNVLLTIGVIGLILLFNTLYRAVGVWPEVPYNNVDLSRTRVLMGWAQALTALIAAFWAFRLRTAWMLLPAGFVGWMAWMAMIDEMRAGNLDGRDLLGQSLYGVLLVGIGLVIASKGWKSHATWLFFLGLTTSMMTLGMPSFGDPLGLNGLVFLLLTVVALGLGIATEHRIFLLYGAIGLYGWLSAVVIETFGGSRPVAFALVLVGIAIVAGGIAWQRTHVPQPPAQSG